MNINSLDLKKRQNELLILINNVRNNPHFLIPYLD